MLNHYILQPRPAEMSSERKFRPSGIELETKPYFPLAWGRKSSHPAAMEQQQAQQDCSVVDPKFVASLLAEISHSEQHFNKLEAEYRKLASTWLLAAFAGMGFIATAPSVSVPTGPTIFLIAVGASLGIQLLWIIDLLTYHRLLLANFIEGLKLEKANPFLPQVRTNMLAQGTVGKRIRFFYLGSSLVPLAFGLGGYFVINHAVASKFSNALVAIAAVALVVTSVTLMIKSSGGWIREEIDRTSKRAAFPAEDINKIPK